MKVTRRDFFVTTAVGAAVGSLEGHVAPVANEVVARYDWIIGKWGDRLSPEQKADILHMLTDNEKGLAAMRAFPLGNDVEPAR